MASTPIKIGYRRFSGKIPLSFVEQGGTGLWLEKRWALLAALKKRGAEIIYLSEPTKYSQYEFTPGRPQDCDVILIEFGSTNSLSYGKDIKLTKEIIASDIPTVYILDDPDLFHTSTRECDRFWINAKDVPAARARFSAKAEYFPIAALQQAVYSHSERQGGIYIGSGKGGREELLMEIKQALPPTMRLDIYGDHFTTLAPFPRPPQPGRYTLYSKYLFSVGINDSTHKRFNWNTGRMTHSVMAGTPYLAEENWRIELPKLLADPYKYWADQYALIAQETFIANQRLEELWKLTT